jgi:hypothetical protein
MLYSPESVGEAFSEARLPERVQIRPKARQNDSNCIGAGHEEGLTALVKSIDQNVLMDQVASSFC